MQDPAANEFDAVVIGGGPAGSTAALVLARAGRTVLVVDKTVMPRFTIGESFLPRTFELMRELNLLEPLRAIPHVPKFGAEFSFGDEPQSTRFRFDQGFFDNPGETFNIARAPFDEMMQRQAVKAGATLWDNTAVRSVLELSDGAVRIETTRGPVRARYLVDASGQATVIARHLKTRRPIVHENLQKIAYFAHFENTKRLPGREEGHPFVAMCDEGWFWMIPLDDKKTSVGLVIDASVARRLGVPADRMLQWGIARCPAVRDRMLGASGPEKNLTIADFSYSCAPYSGPGYFLCGDAAVFLDPVFSSGVCLGMVAGKQAGESIDAILAGRLTPAAARKKHDDLVARSSSTFFRVIRGYYTHSFRELFLHNLAPLRIQKAVLAVLAGNVFPRPPWSLSWRLWLFEQLIRVNRVYALVPRRRPFSLASAAPNPLTMPEKELIPAAATGA